MLVHLLVDGCDRLLERALQEGLVVLMAMMMRGRAGTPLRDAVSNILQSAVDQGEHVLHGLRIVPVVGAAAGQVARTRYPASSSTAPRASASRAANWF